MLTPPHEKNCTCEWCNAVSVAERRRLEKWRPIGIRTEKNSDSRQEAPNEKPFVSVVRTDEVASARKRKLEKKERINHPSTLRARAHTDAPKVVHMPVTYFPSYGSVLAVADRFLRVDRPKAKTSGCWWCQEKEHHADDDHLCGVCVHLLADYRAYLDLRAAAEI